MMTSEQFVTRTRLLAAVLRIVSEEVARDIRQPGPYDDAEAEYADELLLDAARDFVKANEGVRTASQIHAESRAR